MKNSIIITALLLIPFFTFAQLDRSVRPQAGPAPQINIAAAQSFTLSNGLKVFVVENSKLPRVSFSFIFDYDPVLENELCGLADITGQLLKTGTRTKSKQEIDDAIDFIGASVSTSAESLFASALSQHTETLLEVIADIILNANFSQAELARLKTQTISGLAASQNSPEAIISRLRKKLLYGENHPYGQSPTEETINNITLEACNNFYRTYFRPNITYLAVVGDVKLDVIKPLLEKYLGSWARQDVPQHTYSVPEAPSSNHIAIVDRPASVQSSISVAFPVLLKPNSPELMATRLMNSILGGGTARLFYNLRETHGFTYGAYSSLSADKLVGNFNASTDVRNSATDSAITEILYEINRIRTEHVATEELSLHRNEMAGGFALSLESPTTIARFALSIARHNLPEDYYRNYLRNLEALTADDIKIAAENYLTPDNLYIIVVGKADEIAENLKKFSPTGQINYYDTDGNWYDPDQRLMPAPQGLTAQAVIEKYIQAIGGRKRLAKMKDISLKYSALVQGMLISFDIYQKAPNKMRVEISASGMVLSKQIFDGQRGVAEVPMMGQREELEDAQLESMKNQALMNMELNYAAHGITMELLGIEEVKGKPAYKIMVTYPGEVQSYDYYDIETGFKVRSISESGQTDYDNYKAFKKIRFPTVMTQELQGQNLKLELQSVGINKKIQDDFFRIN